MTAHSQQAAERFDQWATTYGDDRISSWFSHYQDLALNRLPLEREAGFLEVGCGTGWAVRRAASRLASGPACGIDISPKMIERAGEKTAAADRAKIEFHVANAESIPYADQSFGSILCSFSIHHYEDPVRALSEMKRVLRPGGSIAIMDSARDISLAIWLQDRWRRYGEKSHVQYYTVAEMADLIRRAGLTVQGDVYTCKKFMDRKKTFTGLMLYVCGK